MSLSVEPFDSAADFLAQAQPWLLRSEAEHSLVLSLAARIAASDGTPGDAPAPYLATVRLGAEVAGVVMRTPPHKLLLSRMPLEAAPLVAASAERFGPLPAVMGPRDVAQAFGRAWARRRAVAPRLGMQQRIFELTTLVPPGRAVPGRARPAEAGDLGLVAGWLDAFHRELGIAAEDARAWAEQHVARGDVLLWHDGAPVAMAAAMARTPSGARVGAVYTPSALRGRGYATAVVAGLTQRLLDGGRRFCSLYTDLANPTSNAIYQRLGYVPVADVADVEFDAL